MRRIAVVAAGSLAVAILLAACADESPTSVGAGLLGPTIQTYEVTLEADQFLLADTTYDQIGTLNDAPFNMVAHDFAGSLDARTLFRVFRPFTVTWTDGEGQSRTDSIAAIVGGSVTLVMDSVASSGAPATVEVLSVTEPWHRGTATWTVREDTAAEARTWATPGGSPGPVMGSGVWDREEGDTVVIRMDSAAVAVWQDTAQARMGGMLRTTTADARLFVQTVTVRFDVVPVDADTVVQAGSAGERKVIVTPEAAPAPAPGELRVGGLPAWRSLLRFRSLDQVAIPCGPGSPPGCTVPLGDVHINLAALVMEPIAAGARRVEQPIRIDGRAVLQTANVPLTRAPLTTPLPPFAPDNIPPARFAGAGPEPEPVRIPVTFFVDRNADLPEGETRWDWLALTAAGERNTFGYARFAGVESDRPPRLHLVVSRPIGELVQ